MFLLAPPKNVIDLIKADHRKVEALYKQYQMPGSTAAQRQMLAYSIIREVVMHSAAEEAVVYPSMRYHMGDAAPDHLLDGHQTLKEELAWLSSRRVHDANYDGRMQRMMEDLVRHVREEETALLPRFAATDGVGEDTLLNLGRWFEFMKRIAPTRPRPAIPGKPAALDVLANGALAPLDWGFDMIRFQGAPPL